MDCKQVVEKIKSFIKEEVTDAGAAGVVIGLSGGVDSAVVCRLCWQTLGRHKVTGLVMPCYSNEADRKDAERFAHGEGISWSTTDLAPFFDIAIRSFLIDHTTAAGNFKARLRMAVLYAYANANNLIVAGTGNRSELKLGYFTKYGDGGVDILPIGDLYKTLVFEVAEYLAIPKYITKKRPSAGLYEGQTDEGELGYSYEEIDFSLLAIAKCHVRTDRDKKIYEMVQRGQHKSVPPDICYL